MPNHCQNVLKILGEQTELDHFKTLALTGTQREVLTSVVFYPPPKEVLTGDTGGGTFARKPGARWQPFAVLSLRLGLESTFEDWGKRAADFRAQLRARGYEVKFLRFGTTTEGEIIDLDADPRPTWYDWRVAAFGTKWEPYGSSLEETECCLLYRFQSAWSPPVAFIQKLIVRFPKLWFNLRFEESGVGFLGEVTETGAVLEAEMPDYPDGDDPEYDRLVEQYYEAIANYLEGA